MLARAESVLRRGEFVPCHPVTPEPGGASSQPSDIPSLQVRPVALQGEAEPAAVIQAQVDIAIVTLSATLAGYAATSGLIRYAQH